MRVFEIYDTTKRGHRACATLEWDEGARSAVIRIDEGATPDDLPFMLALLAESGQLEIEGEWAMRWISERIPPPNRQNIGEILRANGLGEYDEIALLAAGKGRSSQDDFQVREVTERIDYAVQSLGEKEPEDGFRQLCRKIGGQIAAARKAAGITQDQLSERTGIAQAVISRVERGKGNPTLETLYILSCGSDASMDVEVGAASGGNALPG